MRILLLVLLCVFGLHSVPVFGADLQSSEQDHSTDHLWKWSLAALIAASALDVATSMNHSEANPLLRSPSGQFGVRGLLFKSAITSAAITFEVHFAKRSNGSKQFAIANFIQAGALAGIAAYNAQVNRR